jgi:hypothetical protein
MPKPILDCSGVMPSIGQRITAGVAEHVSVDLEREVGTLTDALDKAIGGVRCEWAAALGLEYVAACSEIEEKPMTAHIRLIEPRELTGFHYATLILIVRFSGRG